MISRLPALALTLTLVLAPLLSRAETFTLTDKQGRSIKADVISVADNQVKIKRDDGQTFDLAINTLSEDDQKKLKDWAAKDATRIPASALKIELNRGVFKTDKKDKDGMTLTQEKWGYNITVTNQSAKPIPTLTLKYVLFVKPDLGPGKDDENPKLKRSIGTADIAGIQPLSKVELRTDSIDIYKQKLKPGYVWRGAGGTEMIRDTLCGVWLRVYAGDELVSETCVPESLMKTEKSP